MPRSAFGWDLIDFDRLKRPPTAFAASVYIFVFLILVVILALVGASLWRLVAGVGDYNSEKGADAARNLLLSIGAILAAPFIAWRTWISHLQWKNSIDQLKIQSETLNTSLLTKAVDMLGAMRDEHVEITNKDQSTTYQIIKRANPELRIGGILILKRIAMNSTKEIQYILDILKQYLSSNTEKERNNLEKILESEEELQYHDYDWEYYKKSSIYVEVCIRSIIDISQIYGLHYDFSFGRSVISKVSMSGVAIEYFDMFDCYMVGVSFFGAKLDGCSIDGDKLIDCSFYGADLSTSFFSSRSGKRFYAIDDDTKIPEGYEFGVEKYRDPDFEFEPRRFFVKMSDSPLTGTPLPRRT